MSLVVSANVASAGESVEIISSYLRTAGLPAPIGRESFTLAGTGQLEFTLRLDIAACLSDESRLGGSNSGCPLELHVVLRDDALVAIDSQKVGPITAVPGETTEVPGSVTLQAAATLEVVSGDGQVTWAGQPLFYPVVVRLRDRAGSPIPNRELTVVPGAGGSVSGSPAIRTDATGGASVAYRAGPAAGAQSFTIRSAGGGSPVSLSLGLHAAIPGPGRLAVGSEYTCLAAGAAGQNYCWGRNRNGALGNPSITGTTFTPVPVSTSVAFQRVVAVENNSALSGSVCALDVAGRTYCWGTNVNGLLGVASTDICTGAGIVSDFDCTRTPQPLPGSLSFVSLAAGGMAGGTAEHIATFCGIDGGGTIHCWGRGLGGALGDGSSVGRGTPAPVPSSEKFVEIAMGNDFGCALSAKAEIWCWGVNTVGQLGDGTTASRGVPARIASSIGFVSVAAGETAACALDRSGEAWCWGQALAGGSASSMPVTVPGGSLFRSISVGSLAACGVTHIGEVRCWGRSGNSGVLGAGVVNDSSSVPRSVFRLPLGVELVSVGLGGACALLATTDVYCWGSGVIGTLGSPGVAAVPYALRVNLSGSLPGLPALLIAAQGGAGGPPLTGAVGSLQVMGGFLFVQVLDASGYGISDVPLNLAVVAGGGSLPFGGSVQTVAGGFAGVTSRLRLDSLPGNNTMRVSVASNPALAVDLSVTGVVPGPAASRFCSVSCTVSVTAGINTVQFISTVHVSDANGYWRAGVPVTFTGRGDGPVVTPPLPATIPTNADGWASLATWSPGTEARTDTVDVTIPGLPPLGLKLVVINGPLAGLRFNSAPLMVQAGQVSGPIEVHAEDAFGNPVTSTPVQVALTLVSGPPGGALGGTVTRTSAGGIVLFDDIVYTAPGLYQIRAVSGTISSAVLSVNVTP